MKKEIKTKRAPEAIGPYSQAIVCGNIIYTSGIIPAVPETGEIPVSVSEQAERVFTSLKGLLEDVGSDMENVIKTTVFIKDMNDFAKINEIYKKHFFEPFPARSCVEAARLPKDVMIEVEAIAYITEI